MARATVPVIAAGSAPSVSPTASAVPLPGADEAALRSLLPHASTSSDDAAEEDHPAAGAHSFTSQLNLSIYHGIGGARGCA
jgi:hypothetical protein